MTHYDTLSAFSLDSTDQSMSFIYDNSPFVIENTSKREPQWSSSVKGRLKELVGLKQGWDGYHGIPVKNENAVFALSMIESICDMNTPSPQIVPGSSGDLQIEWHTLLGDIELHVVSPNKVHAWYSMANENDGGVEVELTNNFETVAVWVNKIIGSELAITSTAA